ncbi:molybdopterin-dependent oxidoreductase [Salinirubrum litoreum]|uniref:Molybdopterin-dependent oxidoreductase n=1 Tax=Salinirubrum litoreum TaxID=1126234 RepID=A0ABD5R7A4_9EURY|nr:molybdopterin-dependent oxidoreductase [Salinirubrum litoreum]
MSTSGDAGPDTPRLAARLRSLLARAEPRPRVVDWSIFALVLVEFVTGMVSLTAGDPSQWLLFDVHAVVGPALVVLLVFKLRRVRHRITDRRLWDRTTAISVLAAVIAILALGTGFFWVMGGDFDFLLWNAMNVHIGLGLVLIPLVFLHLRARWRVPRRVDFEGRRTALQYTGLLVGGALFYRAQETANRVFDTPGADRRFTGSKPASDPGTTGNAAFPPTSWVADDPDPIPPDDWEVRVEGLVAESLSFGPEAVVSGADDDPPQGGVAADSELRALLDCTSGWYTEQDWRGVRVGDLLDAAGPSEDARYVRFVSVTGYRWSLPIEEARDALLATHVGGERLSHGHGFPMRLVAPGRRGFQWVKWIERVEVRRQGDPTQWLVTLISGFD